MMTNEENVAARLAVLANDFECLRRLPRLEAIEKAAKDFLIFCSLPHNDRLWVEKRDVLQAALDAGKEPNG